MPADIGPGGLQPTGLAPPDTGPAAFGFKSRERLEDRTTRKPMSFWDRTKILLLLAGLWFVFVLAATGDNPILPFSEAMREQARSKWWLLALIGIEVIRQLHYIVSERSEAYHRFWSERFFGNIERRAGKMNDWKRYRAGRTIRFLFLLFLIDMVLASILHTSPALALVQLPITLFRALPLVFQLMTGVIFIILEFGAMFWFLSRGGTEVYFPDDIKTRFSDVWGQDSVLEKIKENIVFLEDPESIEKRGGYVPGGLLLWGPPGTGKTLMAEAVAGETGRPYVFVDPGAFNAMFMGVGILKVKSLFRKLRKLAVRYGGVIVFFDEADSLGSRGALTPGGVFGGQMTGFQAGGGPFGAAMACNGLSYVDPSTASRTLQSWLDASSGPEPERRRLDRVMPMGMGGGGMGTLQALLAEMSGLKKPKGFMNRVVRKTLGLKPKSPPKYRMLIMMATNMPQSLDEALLRPGRIDRIYKVGYPSKPGRVRTYEGYLAKVNHTLTADDIDKLATITPYATGATIKDTVNESLINAIRAGRDAITWQDVVKAKQLKDLGPPEDVEYIERERHAVAVHEACHAVAAYRVRAHMTIDIATIEKGGTYLGMVASIPPEDQFTRWRSEYEADIIVSLASLVGERMFFEGDNSSGVSGDLETATQIATLMEGYWGMGSTVASHGVTQKVGIGGGGRPGKGDEKDKKDLLETSLGERIEDKLSDLMERTERLLLENRRAILAVAHALETHKTVTGDDIKAIIEGRPGTLIDGTPYGTVEFDRMAEEYHNRVVAAHKGHGKVDVPLPMLNGRHRVYQPQGDVLVETELSEADLAGWAFRRPPPPPESGNGNGNGSGEATNGDGHPE
ncbi:MAG TPA: AAA family ATPase [Acidimicrobiales bacterium]|jgi:cell division protease FtsH|nr:AAA family ATPase [Acidimicrobiales bacterium]